MDGLPQHQHEQQQREVKRLRIPGNHRQMAVGVGPHHDHFVGRPNGATAGDAPNDIVDKLRAEEKTRHFLAPPFGMKFEFFALRLEGVEPEMQTAVKQHHQHQVAHEDVGDPADLELGHAREFRLGIKPGDDSDGGEYDVPREQISRVAEEKIHDWQRARRSFPNRRRIRARVGIPVSSRLPRSLRDIRHRRLHPLHQGHIRTRCYGHLRCVR